MVTYTTFCMQQTKKRSGGGQMSNGIGMKDEAHRLHWQNNNK